MLGAMQGGYPLEEFEPVGNHKLARTLLEAVTAVDSDLSIQSKICIVKFCPSQMKANIFTLAMVAKSHQDPLGGWH